MSFYGPMKKKVAKKFTWCNNWPAGGLIQIRLDRAIVNTRWLEKWPETSVFHSPRVGSDHCPILIYSDPPFNRGPKQFKFEASWADDEECYEVINSAWSNQSLELFGDQWAMNLTNCSRHLSIWSKKFSNSRKEINVKMDQLQVLQEKFDDGSIHMAACLTKDIVELWGKEEAY
ncbi:hypothetical protein M0R45_006861 [Rubus argutus]|uniref:Uncharacterized protein n=1 Tax=Rubus argutus TaxID=59490 RepID=A0AAW1YS50_RUBAR